MASVNQTRKDVLNGWKEIAAYLGRDPRTVERWEKQRSLPVRRLPGSGRATVYALMPELDEWLASSPVRDPGLNPGSVSPTIADSAPVLGNPTLNVPGHRSHPWLRWAAPVTVLLLLCWVGLAAAGWPRRPLPVTPTALLRTPARLHKMVPSSPVVGVEELYLRGCYQSELRTGESLGRAQEAFTAAIRQDPKYAPAYAGLANSYLLLREYSMLPDAQAYPLALEAARKAIAIDPDLAQAHTAMGFVDFFWRWDATAADEQFRRALELDPDLPLTHHWYGSVLLHEGRFREAAAELDVAQRLDPSSGAILTTRALALGLSGRRSEAAEMLQEALNSDRTGRYRNPVTMHSVLGLLSLLPHRDIPRYLAETTLAAELRQDTQKAAAMQMAARIYRAHGEQAMWTALLGEEQRRQREGGATFAMARYKAELGAKEQAMNDLDSLYSRHSPDLTGISVDPLLSGLHREPRFVQLRAAMGLPGAGED